MQLDLSVTESQLGAQLEAQLEAAQMEAAQMEALRWQEAQESLRGAL